MSSEIPVIYWMELKIYEDPSGREANVIYPYPLDEDKTLWYKTILVIENSNFGDTWKVEYYSTSPYLEQQRLKDAFEEALRNVEMGKLSFPEFCGDYGYDEDSVRVLKAYNYYTKCTEEFQSLIGPDRDVYDYTFINECIVNEEDGRLCYELDYNDPGSDDVMVLTEDNTWVQANWKEWISHPGGEATANAGPGFADGNGYPLGDVDRWSPMWYITSGKQDSYGIVAPNVQTINPSTDEDDDYYLTI